MWARGLWQQSGPCASRGRSQTPGRGQLAQVWVLVRRPGCDPFTATSASPTWAGSLRAGPGGLAHGRERARVSARPRPYPATTQASTLGGQGVLSPGAGKSARLSLGRGHRTPLRLQSATGTGTQVPREACSGFRRGRKRAVELLPHLGCHRCCPRSWGQATNKRVSTTAWVSPLCLCQGVGEVAEPPSGPRLGQEVRLPGGEPRSRELSPTCLSQCQPHGGWAALISPVSPLGTCREPHREHHPALAGGG